MSYPNLASQKLQQSYARKLVSQTDCQTIFNLLTSPDLFKKVESLLPEHRERRFPPTETLSMFIAQVFQQDPSCQNVVNQAAVKSLVSGLDPCSTHTGGYCRARKRLPSQMPKDLAMFIGQSIEENVPVSWRWHDRRIRVVDGTSITMPDTKDNQSVYPQQGGQKAGLGFPIARLVAVTDLNSGAVQGAAFGRFMGKGSDEKALLRSLSDIFEAGDIILGDAFFPSYLFIAEMLDKGVDILMEQIGGRRQSTDFRLGSSLGKLDHIFEITKPGKKPDWIDQATFDKLPDTIAIREFKTKGRIMVTTMKDVKTYSKKSLYSLYKKRWEIETNLGQIKTILGMNVLSCKTPEMIEKEIWVYLLGYNLIRLLMVQSAYLSGLQPIDLSFKHCVQLWLNYLQQSAVIDDIELTRLLMLMAQQRVANRPGRIEPRALKRRPKACPMLMKPRSEAREYVRENGHPKKLK
jgi:hypothetical protein